MGQLRAKKAAAKKPVAVRRMPPTTHVFHLHLLRCAYQLLVWKKSGVFVQSLPSPLEFGYELEDGFLMPIMSKQEVSAPELLNDILFECEDGCEGDDI